MQKYKRRNIQSTVYDCKCEGCGKDFVIKCQPRNWKYKIIVETPSSGGKTKLYDLFIYCSEECKTKARGL